MNRSALVLVTLLLACPLFALPGAGFDAVRLPAVLLLAAALLGVAFLRSARGRERPPGPAPLRTAGLLLLGLQVLSLAAARRIEEAVVPILLLFAGVSIFACLRGGLLRREAALGLAPVISGIGLLVALIGIGQQLMGKEALALEGNRNYAGALAAMLLPATVAFTRAGRPPNRLLAGIASAGLLGLLLLSESRGGVVAAAVGLVLVGAALGLKRVERGTLAAGLALLAMLGLVAAFQGRKQLSPERMETAGFRLEVWKSGGRMFLARPALGWGAGSFAAEYPPYRSESEFRTSHKHSPEAFRELEDAHSSWVQTAVETGLPGLLALLLVAYVAARLWRYYVKVAQEGESAALLAGLGGAAAAYLVAGLFNTLTLKTSPTILFWCFLGLMEVIGDGRPWRKGESREWRVAFPAAAAFVALFGALWTGNLGLADAAFTEGMTTRDAGVREARMRESLDKNPFSWRAHYELALTLSSLQRFPGAAEEARATLRIRPHHVEALNHAGVCLLQSGADPRTAETLLRAATETAPFYYKSFHNLGLLEFRQGRRAEARGHFNRAIELNPKHALSHFNRGVLNLAEGEGAAALQDLRKAAELGVDVGAGLRSMVPAALSDSRFAEFFR